MLNPCHPSEILCDILKSAELSVTGAAWRLSCTRQVLSWLLNGKTGISPAMLLVLERIGRSNAGFWMRQQVSYELVRERQEQAATERRTGALNA